MNLPTSLSTERLPVPSIVQRYSYDPLKAPAYLEQGNFDFVPPVRVALAEHCKQPREPSPAGPNDLSHDVASRAKHNSI